MGETLPIIYVRGFAGNQRGIDKAGEDPFYGFNEGSSHARVGSNGETFFYQFEGCLVRLIRDHKYAILVEGNQKELLLNADPGALPPNSIWIYRFYDDYTHTFRRKEDAEDEDRQKPPDLEVEKLARENEIRDKGNSQRRPLPFEIEKSAQGLAEFIDLVRLKTEGNPRVNLMAHSMGGLICRSALQREILEPELSVSKLCTIGTPHGGIDPDLGGDVGDWIMETFGPRGSDIFTHSRMKEYLLPDGFAIDGRKSWDPREMVGTFPEKRVLSVVGTNANDYDVAGGWSTRVMGPQSDGLVAIRNAYVHGSPRAYVHRSHSGPWGLVNSEETYQNVRRFLFGGLRVEIGFTGVDFHGESERVWQAETHLAIRGVRVTMHEQRADHYCPLDLNAEARGRPTPMSPVPLVTAFLLPREDKAPSRYALSLRVMSPDEDRGSFRWGEHLERIPDWEDSLVVDIAFDGESKIKELRWQWNSELHGRIAQVENLGNVLEGTPENDGTWLASFPLLPSGKALLGKEAALQAHVSLWD
jgi:hypothetical protein